MKVASHPSDLVIARGVILLGSTYRCSGNLCRRSPISYGLAIAEPKSPTIERWRRMIGRSQSGTGREAGMTQLFKIRAGVANRRWIEG